MVPNKYQATFPTFQTEVSSTLIDNLFSTFFKAIKITVTPAPENIQQAHVCGYQHSKKFKNL
jgi:hypothetical protein